VDGNQHTDSRSARPIGQSHTSTTLAPKDRAGHQQHSNKPTSRCRGRLHNEIIPCVMTYCLKFHAYQPSKRRNQESAARLLRAQRYGLPCSIKSFAGHCSNREDVPEASHLGSTIRHGGGKSQRDNKTVTRITAKPSPSMDFQGVSSYGFHMTLSRSQSRRRKRSTTIWAFSTGYGRLLTRYRPTENTSERYRLRQGNSKHRSRRNICATLVRARWLYRGTNFRKSESLQAWRWLCCHLC
jgi:hypothetical protein